ncbi:MAG: Asp-tRNA(Asn)/Glu-tRNA(Gln) amidotransferase subunit GatC [Clostridia bacterium]|nr:Asp-tRNA(Asn)/Glu-tRNA(Gln) amidotransferase subunit GatC [Clostridia bacterium]
MKVTTEQIKHVAELARLKLTDEEVKSLNMEAVIEFADKLSELDAEQIAPTNHVSDIYNVFREDVEVPSYDRDDILKNAPAKARGCVLVPKVVE